MRPSAGPHTASPVELKARIELEREGVPFLMLRDATGAQRLIRLPSGDARLTVGRSADCDVALTWDAEVSSVHAELARVGPGWTVDDGGLSRNGSFVNGDRVVERRRLVDGDTLRFGTTAVLYREPRAAATQPTVPASDLPGPRELSSAQRAVLRALCRPFAERSSWAKPATNADIAAELVLSVEAVKGHLRVLFAKFSVDALPQNEKRLRLAERALVSGAVTLHELRETGLEPRA
jgi:FHA domain-containing protein